MKKNYNMDRLVLLKKPVRLNSFGKTIVNTAYRDGCSFWEYDESDNMPPFEANYKKICYT